MSDLSRGTVVFFAKALLLVGVIILLAGAVFSSMYTATSHPLVSRLVVISTGLLLISFGVSLLLKKQLVPLVGKALMAFLMALLFFETLSVAGLYIYSKSRTNSESERERNLRIHSGIYRPFVIWRSNPYSSEEVNVGSDGLRLVPGAEFVDTAFKVFVFGGSTMFGWNTFDSLTICGNLQRLLSASMDQPVCVVNFGQQGYVNTQEIIELQLQLKAGNVPDLAIFYDGTNEIWSAISSDTVGVHFLLEEISQLYENRHFQRENSHSVGILAFLSELNSVVLCRMLLGIEKPSEATLFQEEPSRCIVEGEDFIRSEVLAETIMDSYEVNLRIIDALSNEFEFDYLCFWQPVVVTGDKPLTDNELSIYNSTDPYMLSVYRHCEERAIEMQAQYSNFFSITDTFDETTDNIFTDICHVTDQGDRLIAQLIFSKINSILLH